MDELPRYKSALLFEFKTIIGLVRQATELNFKTKNARPIAFLGIVINYLEAFISFLREKNDPKQQIPSLQVIVELTRTTKDLLGKKNTVAGFQAIAADTLVKLEGYLVVFGINFNNEQLLVGSPHGKFFRDAYRSYGANYPASFTGKSSRIAKQRGAVGGETVFRA